MVTVSSVLWHAGTTPCGHLCRHCSHVIPESQDKKLILDVMNKKREAKKTASNFHFHWVRGVSDES